MNTQINTINIPKKLYGGLSKLFYKLGVNGNDVIEDFIYSYLEYAFTQSAVKNDVYLSTGFGRKSINSYLEKIETTKTTNEKNESNYEILITLLEVYAKKSKNAEIPIYGKYESFNCAFNAIRQPSNNISAKSMLNKFIRVGILEQVDDKHIKFITTIPVKGLNDPDDIIRLLSDNINRLCHTLLHNMAVKKNEDTLVQSSYWSNSIESIYHHVCTNELREETRMYIKNCSIIIDKFENKGCSKKEADVESLELGISAFIFKNSK